MEAIKKIELNKITKIILVAVLGTLLLTISAKIKIPFSGVPADTGKPKMPSNKYKLIVNKPIFGPNVIPINKTTKVCMVIGTG